MLLPLLFACDSESNPHHPPGRSSKPESEDTGDSGDTGIPKVEVAKWQFLVYMDGDNDLEDWVIHDLNELELVGSGDGVEVLVQADRIDGYSTENGDWTDARRFRIEGDDDLEHFTTPVAEEIGEVDMGSPATLAGFLDWASTNYPAERRALILWNHGTGWELRDPDAETEVAPPPGIAYDDTDGGYLSFAEGTFAEGVSASVTAHGKFDVIAFDACNMGNWEVMHSLVPFAHAGSGAETSEGMEGLQYGPALAFLRANVEATPQQFAEELSRGAVEEGGENTHSAIDLDALIGLDGAIDALAGAALADADVAQALMVFRQSARGVEAGRDYKNWYLDIGDLAAVLVASGDPVLAPLGEDILTELDVAVVHSFASERFSWVGGLTIWFDPYSAYIDDYIDMYTEGVGASWSVDTRWDDLMLSYMAL